MGKKNFKEIGVVGGGLMGAGIAYTLLNGGRTVFLKEIDKDLADRSAKKVGSMFEKMVKKGHLSESEMEHRLGLLHFDADYDSLSNVDLVIEAVPESLEVKQKVFKTVDQVCRPDAILASNTSSFSISQLGGYTGRASRVIGMHWFNPPHIMKLIEIVPGLETSPETIDSLLDLCADLGKTPVKVKECAGFLVNRLLGSYVNEAVYMMDEGLSPQDVDDAAESMGVPMGPIMLGDMVGWDTIHNANTSLFDGYGSRFTLPSLLTQVYRSGRLGAKTGKGFYPYEGGKVLREKGTSIQPQEQLSSRLFSALINEGIRCLDENVASRGDIDTAMKAGAGMPKGPLQWADEMGLDILLQRLMALKAAHGERFLPSPLLKRKVAAGHLGKASGRGFFQY